MSLQNNLPTILENATDLILKNVAALEDVPVGKWFAWIAKRMIEIDNEEEALLQAVGVTYVTTLTNFLRKEWEITDKERYLASVRALAQYAKDLKNKSLPNLPEPLLGSFDIKEVMESDLVKLVVSLFKDFVQNLGLSQAQQTELQRYIQYRFQDNFFKLIEDAEIKYKKLNNFIKSPRHGYNIQWHQQDRYKRYLVSLYEQPVILSNIEKLTLDKLYVEPYYGIHEKSLEEYCSNVFKTYEKSIHPYINNWLLDEKDKELKNTTARILFLLGQPGQGKSSFCKRLVHDIYTKTNTKKHTCLQQHTFLIILRKFNKKAVGALSDNPLETIKAYLKDEHDLIISKKKLRKSLLVLDGLDELYIQNHSNNQEVEEICKALIRCVENNEELKILVTSRYGYIGEKIPNDNSTLFLRLEAFTMQQQKSWLRRYKHFATTNLTLEKLEEINKQAEHQHLKELISQPILLHMVATLENELDVHSSRTTIYKQLFDELVARNWAKGQVFVLEGITPEQLRHFLQDIAFEIFKTGRTYVHKSEIIKLKNNQFFKSLIGNPKRLKKLMIAFYTNEIVIEESNLDKTNYEYGIEFLHESLQEYLTAEKIWQTISDKFLKVNESSINTVEEALKVLGDLFMFQPLTKEVIKDLIEVIESDKDIDKQLLANRLHFFWEELIERDFLDISKSELLANNPIDKALDVFYGYWTVLIHLDETKNYIKENTKKRFAYLLKCLLGNIIKIINLKNQSLSHVNLMGVYLSGVNLRVADLSGANLRVADLSGANLRVADLSGADLRVADLSGADLSRADLIQADLIQADLSRAYLSGAYLSRADLSGADLSGAYLRGAYLSGADLSGANLSGANLRGADLRGADLSRADLRGADLSRADLTGSKNLTFHKLSKTKSLYECQGLPKELKEKCPHLFEKPAD